MKFEYNGIEYTGTVSEIRDAVEEHLLCMHPVVSIDSGDIVIRLSSEEVRLDLRQEHNVKFIVDDIIKDVLSRIKYTDSDIFVKCINWQYFLYFGEELIATKNKPFTLEQINEHKNLVVA